MPLYLGLDSSTQSLSAIVVEIEGTTRRVLFESSLNFDGTFPAYGTRHGVLPSSDPAVARSSPLMWAEALDTMLGRVAAAGLDLGRLAAISGSAQQHGSVYLNASAAGTLTALDPARPLGEQIRGIFSRPESPIWMDSSTSQECAEIAAAVGGQDVLAQHTGSRAFERFTGPQIRRFFHLEPEAYAATARIHLVSSYLATLLAGREAAIDPGDGSGMNLMELATTTWWPPAVEATAPDLASRLPSLAPSSSVAGTLSPYWQKRHGLPPARVVVWSGDNPCSLIGTGLIREGRLAISLGTSDVVFGLMDAPRVDRGGIGHVFGAPTGAFMGLTVFLNGSLARERIRDEHGLSWQGFSDALRATPPANLGRVLLPWFSPEITPFVATPGVRRYGLPSDDAAANVRAVIEAQMLSMARHAAWMGVAVDTIHATGGASANRDILRVMADVFGAAVYQFDVGNSASLGAALRAAQADAAADGRDARWEDVIQGLAEPAASTRLDPDPARHALYRAFGEVYAACEAHALGRGPAPAEPMAAFRARLPQLADQPLK
jgi:xylulokinase